MANKNVFDVIEERRRSGSLPGQRTDDYKLALCFEGGGMRGVVSGGSAKAIDELRLLDVFDVVYGSSSGGFNGLYLLSGNVVDGAKMYLDYANNSSFVSPWRFLRHGPLFDMSYMFHQIATYAPVNWQRVLKSPVPLHITATRATQGQAAVLKNFKDANELMSALRATAHVPNSRRAIALWRRHGFVDSSISDPFCLHTAIKENSTHVLILATAPIKGRRSLGVVDRKLVAPYLAKVSPHLATAYIHHGEYSVNGLAHIWNHYDGTHISAIAPAKDTKLPSQVATKRRVLAGGYLAGLRASLHELAPENLQAPIISSVRAYLKI